MISDRGATPFGRSSVVVEAALAAMSPAPVFGKAVDSVRSGFRAMRR